MKSPAKLPTRALFWDIDGTLLVTGRAGMIAWERAFGDLTGGRAFPTVRPDGLTDHQIAAWLLGYTAIDRPAPAAEQAAAADLVARYQSELVSALPLRQGRVLDHVVELLEWAASTVPPLLSWLVTGNTRQGGTAKLRHYGLDRYFREEQAEADACTAGSFSTEVEPRARIVRRAFEEVQARLPGLHPGEILLIGDTPHDIEGAHATGIPALAVASNVHSIEELAGHRPWRVRPALPPASEFARLIAASG